MVISLIVSAFSLSCQGLLESVREGLVTAYSLPEDKTYDVDRTLEDIFYRAVRYNHWRTRKFSEGGDGDVGRGRMEPSPLDLAL